MSTLSLNAFESVVEEWKQIWSTLTLSTLKRVLWEDGWVPLYKFQVYSHFKYFEERVLWRNGSQFLNIWTTLTLNTLKRVLWENGIPFMNI